MIYRDPKTQKEIRCCIRNDRAQTCRHPPTVRMKWHFKTGTPQTRIYCRVHANRIIDLFQSQHIAMALVKDLTREELRPTCGPRRNLRTAKQQKRSTK